MLVGMSNPSKVEKKAYNSGSIIFKLIPKTNAIFILFKIKDLEWSDIAYSFYLDFQIKGENYREQLQTSYPKKFNLVLFDTYTKNVVVKRVITLSDEFAKGFRDAVLEQCQNPHTIKDYKNSTNRIYKNYSSEQLAMSKLVSATFEMLGEDHEVTEEVVYDSYGYGTNKAIPRWIYKEIHDPKIYGIITKDQIPDTLLHNGVFKTTYKNVKGKYWVVKLYKTQKRRKKKRR